MDFKAMIREQGGASGKAIGAYPDLMAGPTQPISVGGSPRVSTPFGQRTAGRHLNAYGGNVDAIDWVMDCVRLITETASSAEWHFEKQGVRYIPESQRDEQTPKEVKNAPYLLGKLFEEPNPFMGYEELVELTLIDYLLTGNAYWLKWRPNDAGQPLALYRLAPPLIKVVPGEWGIDSYEYSVPGTGKLKLPPSQVMHFKMPNPHDPYYGLGIIQGGSRVFDMDLALTDTMASYYEKRAQPSMVVQSDRRVPKDVFKRLQNQLRAMYGGPRNAGALMVLEAGLKYQSISPSAQDAAFESLTNLSRDRILAMFRVPASLLGYNATEVTGAGNNDQRIFDQKTMRPLLNKFQKAVSRGITSSWELDFKIDYDYVMPAEQRLQLASTFAALPGVKVREIRDYAGLDPLGDWRDDVVLNLPGEDGTAADTTAGHPDQNLAGEAGRPPNPENTVAFPSATARVSSGRSVRDTNVPKPRSLSSAASGKAITAEEQRATIEGKAISEMSFEEKIEALKAIGEQRIATLEAELDAKAVEPAKPDLEGRIIAPDDVLMSDRDIAIDSITADLTADIKEAVHALERDLLDELERAVEGKAPGDRIRSKLRQSKAWKKFQEVLASAMEKSAKRSLSTAVVQQSTLGRRADEEVDYEALARELVFRGGGVRKITANLRDDIARKVAQALKDGETKADIERAIRGEIDRWRDGHAETVAMTEAVHAYNEGVITVAEMAGDSHVFVHDGRDHDEPCIEADGQVWTLAEARERRLEHPRCRRAFTPISLSEEPVS
jgi:HK97 family phage portal protein